MTWEEEKQKVKEWYLDECKKIREKYPHTKYQLDHTDAEDQEQRKLDKEMNMKLLKLRDKYRK